MTPKWDRRFWNLAGYIAKWSKDPSAKVGAVIATDTGGAIALGYNGFPTGVEDSGERLKSRRTKLEMIVHAELNALVIAGQAAKGATIYIRGKPICSRCAGLIIQSGIGRVIASDPYLIDKKSKWRRPGIRAIEMLAEAEIPYKFFR
jgi:dCMP deaminase